MSNWQYANQTPTKQFRSANSVPRDLDLFEYNGETYCGVTPSRELNAVRGKAISKLSSTCEVVVDLKGSSEIVFSNNLGEQVVMVYDAAKSTFSMDRTRSYASFSEAFPTVTVAPTYGEIKQLRIFIDNCSMEAFDAAGKMAMTNLVFPSVTYNYIKVKGGMATIYQINY
jgi:levanase/fructan beta-fructosidase